MISALRCPRCCVILAATGALRGVLDLRTPLIVDDRGEHRSTSCSTSSFVYGFDLGIRGAAAGTAIAQWVAAIWLGVVVVRRARRASAVDPPAYGRDRAGRLATASRCWSGRSRCEPRSCWRPWSRPSSATCRLRPTRSRRRRHVPRLRPRRDRDRRADPDRPHAGRRRRRRHPRADQPDDRRGASSPASWLPCARRQRALLARLFSPDPAVQDALVPALLVVAVIQPLSGVVFVLDGVLIGAGDGAYLAWAGLPVLAAYAPLALAVGWTRRRLHLAVDRLRRIHRGATGDVVATTARRPVDGARHLRSDTDVDDRSSTPPAD